MPRKWKETLKFSKNLNVSDWGEIGKILEYIIK